MCLYCIIVAGYGINLSLKWCHAYAMVESNVILSLVPRHDGRTKEQSVCA